ncbi:MAG TPA: hypothetical protein VD963_05875 [Phycisphaerales bacterium]|nr:hypothetical protein [Phycisphaerales bacterium]
MASMMWRAAVIAVAGVAMGVAAPGALAQSESSRPSATSPGARRPVRPPAVDLQGQARRARPGQVMLGEGGRNPAADGQGGAETRAVPDREGAAPVEVAVPEREAVRAPRTAPVEDRQTRPRERAEDWAARPDPVDEPVGAIEAGVPGGRLGGAGGLGMISAEPVRLEVVEVTGAAAEWRRAPGAEGIWSRPEVGEGGEAVAEVRTGPFSTVTLRLEGDYLVTIERMTVARVGMGGLDQVRWEDGAGGGRGQAGSRRESEAADRHPMVVLERGRVRAQPERVGDDGRAPTPLSVRTERGVTTRRVPFVVEHGPLYGTSVRVLLTE